MGTFSTNRIYSVGRMVKVADRIPPSLVEAFHAAFLLFFPTDGLRCRPHWSVHCLNGSITLDGRTDLFTPWVTPLLWMVVQI